MNILINGCSFTGGANVVHDETTGMVTNNGQTTWATFFEEDNTVNNIAVGGNSNDKILRRTIEEIDKELYDMVIIQWTAIHRKERYSDRISNWVNFCQDGRFVISNDFDIEKDSSSMYGFHTDNHKHMDKDNPQMKSTLKSYDKIAQGLTHDALYGKLIQDYRIEYFKNVITLQQILEKQNINYIFTSMSFENHIPTIKNNNFFDLKVAKTNFETSMLSQMDLSKWCRAPMTHMMNQNVVSQNDGHPNEKGHKLIYNHILQELNTLYG